MFLALLKNFSFETSYQVVNDPLCLSLPPCGIKGVCATMSSCGHPILLDMFKLSPRFNAGFSLMFLEPTGEACSFACLQNILGSQSLVNL